MSQKIMIDQLYQVFVDSYAVYLKTQNYHWNVKGPQFAALHGLFEEQYTELAEAIDVLAERLRTFEIFVKADFDIFQKTTAIKNSKEEASASEMLNDLIEALETLIKGILAGQKAAQEAGDTATEDLLISRQAEHEKALWMLKSSL